MTGVTPTQQTVRWQQRMLALNDQVRIKIVETQTVDKPEVLQIAPDRGTQNGLAHIQILG